MAEEEASFLKTKSWLLTLAVPALLALLNILLTTQINSAATEIKETRTQLVELSTNMKVQQVQVEYLGQRMSAIEEAKKEAAEIHKGYETRLNSAEQRLALHDEWINTHKLEH